MFFFFHYCTLCFTIYCHVFSRLCCVDKLENKTKIKTRKKNKQNQICVYIQRKKKIKIPVAQLD